MNILLIKVVKYFIYILSLIIHITVPGGLQYIEGCDTAGGAETEGTWQVDYLIL